jgi:hypothetical protein
MSQRLEGRLIKLTCNSYRFFQSYALRSMECKMYTTLNSGKQLSKTWAKGRSSYIIPAFKSET